MTDVRPVVHSSSRGRVLLIDDSRTARLMTSHVLQRAGFEVQQADSAIAAIAILKADTSFSCIISDVNMPNMSGLSFIKFASQLVDFRDVTMVVLSVEDSVTMREALLAAGASTILAKPLQVEALLEAVG